MGRMRRLAIGCALCVSLGAHVRAQVEVADQSTKEVTIAFDVDAISFASTDSSLSRIDVYIQVPYERLSFVKADDGYRASYELTIDLYDTVGRLVSEKMWTEQIKTASFDQSVSTLSFSRAQRSFEVEPGRYVLAFVLRDNETKTAQRQSRQLAVSNFRSSRFALSDIMLVERLTLQSDKRSMLPAISQNVGDISGGFHIFFEAYNEANLDSVLLVTSIFNKKKEQVQQSDTLQQVIKGRNQLFIKVDNSALPLGDYTLYVQAFRKDAQERTTASALGITSRSFFVRWVGAPTSIKDLDAAVDQLSYVAKDAELAYIREAKTPDEKQKRFLDFWKKKDPNPNTPRNEKMEEYYARVGYANKTFKHYVDGWKTDMGMVYIIFGSPNNVERHPFDSDSKPYEIWSYYELNHSFVFIDQTGFGDYRLTTPIWDVWQRKKD